MENKEYLSEEKYQKAIKKISMVSIVILLIGLLVGGGLIALGVMKSNKEKVQIVEEEKTEKKTQTELDAEIKVLESERDALFAKQQEEFMENGFSEEYSRLSNEREEKDLKIMAFGVGTLDTPEAFDSFKRESDEIKSNIKVAPYYMFGSFIIFSSIIIAGFVFLISKRREIAAFTVQQGMPVAKEGLEKMAPTFGEVGKEIAKGVSEGLKESSKEE